MMMIKRYLTYIRKNNNSNHSLRPDDLDGKTINDNNTDYHDSPNVDDPVESRHSMSTSSHYYKSITQLLNNDDDDDDDNDFDDDDDSFAINDCDFSSSGSTKLIDNYGIDNDDTNDTSNDDTNDDTN